jgi:transposase-like protein
MKFTNKEVLELQKNPNVVKCSQKAITYSKDFKLRAVKQYMEENLSCPEIFRLAGFDINALGRKIPNDRVSDWKYIYRTYGEIGLRTDRRGRSSSGRPRTSTLSEKEKLERLEAEVAYLKAENDFLKQLRAKRAE